MADIYGFFHLQGGVNNAACYLRHQKKTFECTSGEEECTAEKLQ